MSSSPLFSKKNAEEGSLGLANLGGAPEALRKLGLPPHPRALYSSSHVAPKAEIEAVMLNSSGCSRLLESCGLAPSCNFKGFEVCGVLGLVLADAAGRWNATFEPGGRNSRLSLQPWPPKPRP